MLKEIDNLQLSIIKYHETLEARRNFESRNVEQLTLFMTKLSSYQESLFILAKERNNIRLAIDSIKDKVFEMWNDAAIKSLILHDVTNTEEEKTKNAISNPPYNHSNSQVSDPERIYEDTSLSPRQMSLSQIKTANGTYLSPSTSSTSGFSTLVPPHLHQSTFSGDNCQYPLVPDSMQTNYATVYNNTNSVAQDMCFRDGSTILQPVYLETQSFPQVILFEGHRYVHDGNAPVQSVATGNTEPCTSLGVTNNTESPGSDPVTKTN